jgi:hypothetical protein
MIGGAAQSTKYFAEHWMKMEPGHWAREPTWIAPYTRSTPSGGTTQVRGHYRGGQWVESQAVPDEAARAEWLGKSKLITHGGTVLTFGVSALDQVMEDRGRSDLSTTDRVGRAAGATAYVGTVSWAGGAAGAWAGAEGGAMVGGAIGSVIPVVGTAAGGAIGGVVGAIGGGIVGSGLAGAAADATKGVAVHIGQAAANGVVDGATGLAHDASHVWAETEGARQTVAHVASGAWDKTAGVRHTVSDVADALNPF